MKTRFVRADELRVGQLVWEREEEHQLLRVRDAADGTLVLTLRPAMGPALEVRVAPWAQLSVIES